MFESIMRFFKKLSKKEEKASNSKDAAKERLHLVLMQDRANVSADFLELMKQEIIEVIKKYIDIDEKAIDVRLTNKENEDGTNGAPALYANIPIINIKNEARKIDANEAKNKEAKAEEKKDQEKEIKKEDNKKEEHVKKDEEKPKKIEQDSQKQNIKQEQKSEKQEQKKEIKENDKIENNKNDSKEEIKSENKKKSDLN